MDAFVMPAFMVLSAVMRATQVTTPISMKAKMITNPTSQVRRLCSAGGKGFRTAGSGMSGSYITRSVVTVIPRLLLTVLPSLLAYPKHEAPIRGEIEAEASKEA
jgi:hypothetical protein